MSQCVTLWIGDDLGPVERACLRSVMRQGHAVALYCYTKVEGVPVGVELRDASTILPKHRIFRQRNGSVAAFSDWFRYELLRRGLGTWLDTDIYLLQPVDERADYLFGEEKPGVINNAVLRLPADSRILDELLAPFDGIVPHWLRARHRLASGMRKCLGGGINVGRLPWGTTGPAAITAIAAKLGLSSQALPPAAFYPVAWEHARWIIDPAIELRQVTTDRTIAIHLWNECIRGVKELPPPDGSFLQRLWTEGAD